ncbi:MAG: hypothetical protein Q9185_002661 [Variospora sp. 1 TL-2023]
MAPTGHCCGTSKSEDSGSLLPSVIGRSRQLWATDGNEQTTEQNLSTNSDHASAVMQYERPPSLDGSFGIRNTFHLEEKPGELV